MKYNMSKIKVLFQCLEVTALALKQNIRDVLDGVFVFQVHFIRGALDRGVGAVGTVVGPQAGVSHLVPPEGVVVGAGVLAGVAPEGFVSGVFPRVELQS